MSTWGISIDERNWKHLSGVLFLSTCGLILWTFLDYGITWDEETQKNYGNAILAWYGSFFRNSAALNYSDLFLYGGFFEALVQLSTNLVLLFASTGVFETRHLLNAFTGLLGIVGSWRLGTLLAGTKAGFLSALCLTLTPRYYGDIFNNPKDVPFAVLFLWSFYYIVLFYRNLPSVSKSLTVKLGVMLGLALGVRVGGVLLYAYLMAIVATWFVHQFRAGLLTTKRAILQVCLSLAGVFVLSWLVMLIGWPWAQVSPIAHPLEAIKVASRFTHAGPLLFNGAIYTSNDVPWTYLPVWLLVSLPEFYFVIIAIVGSLILYSIQTPKIDSSLIGVLIAFVAPILFVIITCPTMYDGMRHFLFLLPILAVFSGITCARFIDLHITGYVKTVTLSIIVFSMSLTAYDMIDLHPYQSIYFNRLIAGGLTSAHLRFETDYWGSSYKEGVAWLLDNFERRHPNRIKVAVQCGWPVQIGYYLNKEQYISRERKLMQLARMDHSVSKMPPLVDNEHDLFSVTRNPEEADIVLSTTRAHCHTKLNGEVLYTVRRKNVPILYIVRVSDQLDPNRASGGDAI